MSRQTKPATMGVIIMGKVSTAVKKPRAYGARLSNNANPKPIRKDPPTTEMVYTKVKRNTSGTI